MEQIRVVNEYKLFNYSMKFCVLPFNINPTYAFYRIYTIFFLVYDL